MSFRKLGLVAVVLGWAFIASAAQVGPPTTPRATPNCSGVAALRPLTTTLPVGVNYTVTINGCNFGASAGTVKICDQATFGGTCATASPVSWSATSVSAVVRAGSLTVGNTVYLYVTDATNVTNTNGLGGFPLGRSALWVRTDGNDNCNGTANLAGSSGNCAWRHINFAVSQVAGDAEVRVQAGTYVETTSAWVSGTSGHTVTLVASGTVTTCGMSFNNKNYIRVIGFTMNPNASSCGGSPSPIVYISGTNTGLEFWHNDVGNLGNNNTFGNTTGDPDRCHKCIVIGGSFHDIGGTPDTASVTALNLYGDDVFVGYTDFRTICYLGLGPAGNRGRMVNLNFSALIQCNNAGAHPDNYYIANSTLGFSNNLIEANLGIGTPTSMDNKYFHAQNDGVTDWNDIIWRFNHAYNYGSASMFSMYANASKNLLRWRHYNNTAVQGSMAQNQSDTQYDACGNIDQRAALISAWVFNNICVHSWTEAARTSGSIGMQYESAGTFTKDYNLLWDDRGAITTFKPYWLSQVHKQSNVNPNFVNQNTGDLHLTAGSGCGVGARCTGGPLTAAIGAGVNSTSLTVTANTGSFFIGDNSANQPAYGGALFPGDFLTIGTTTVQVASVAVDVLTLVTPATWNNGDPVCYGTSCVVDLGAYPFKAGGYGLTATKSIVNGTATIIPNDSSLVRFVAFYSGGVPYAIDNSSPYSAPLPTGVFSARVYSRYASQTRWITVQ